MMYLFYCIGNMKLLEFRNNKQKSLNVLQNLISLKKRILYSININGYILLGKFNKKSFIRNSNNITIDLIQKPVLRGQTHKKIHILLMIPGKVFFESINVSQELSKRYEIHLLLNGIFYDKIKIFQTKYLCLTANDLFEVQLTIKYPLQHNADEPSNPRQIRNIQHAVQAQHHKPQSYLKVVVPQTYKLLIESKTIEVKFILNKKHKQESIKINLTFQPVASFNRKKLGAGTMGKTINKNFKNHQNFLKSSQNKPRVLQFNQGDSLASHDQFFPQQLNLNKKNEFSQIQSPISNHSKAQTMKHQKFFGYNNQEQMMSKDGRFSKERKQRHQGFNPQQQFSQTIRSETFSDLYDKQANTSRTYNMGTKQNMKISQDSNEDSNHVNEIEYQTEVNYNSSQTPSELDTLESLAYQREKILGQLFGKFSHRNKK